MKKIMPDQGITTIKLASSVSAWVAVQHCIIFSQFRDEVFTKRLM